MTQFNFDLIKNIKSPADIKRMTREQLREAAKEMRDAILYRTSLISGHVGSNLGDTELVIALHYVFDAPTDKLVFDVSHQAFVHKMITGRVDGFINPDDFDNVGEYTVPSESPEYDLFYAGHTSPSISLCAGIARTRDIRGETYNVVAVIGDGSLSGGEALEGLNVAASLGTNFIVVVIDNDMAIAPNTGGIYEGLRRLRATNGTSDDNIFKAFGFDYIYVAEGNNLDAVTEALMKVRNTDHPVVVHVNTQKGEGYIPAERDREYWHYSAPFDIPTGNPVNISEAPDYTDILCDFIMDKGVNDPRSLIISSATPGAFDLDAEKRARLGKHYLSVDIAEQTGVAAMAGAARAGAKVIYPVMGTFLQRAYDQLMEDWAMDPSPALMVVGGTGICGIPDETHLGFWDIPYITSIPDIVYLAPANAEEFKAMLEWGYAQSEHKVAVRMPSFSYEHADYEVDTDYSYLDRFRITHKGSGVALIGAGDFYAQAVKVAGELAKAGIDATIINPRFVSGVDTAMIESLVADHQLVATLEDGSVAGGFGQRVAAAAGPTGMKSLVFGIPKRFYDRYDASELMTELGLDPDMIASRILATIKAQSPAVADTGRRNLHTR